MERSCRASWPEHLPWLPRPRFGQRCEASFMKSRYPNPERVSPFEIRNRNSEIRNKFEFQNDEMIKTAGSMNVEWQDVLVIGDLGFGFVSDFEIRISDLAFGPSGNYRPLAGHASSGKKCFTALPRSGEKGVDQVQRISRNSGIMNTAHRKSSMASVPGLSPSPARTMSISGSVGSRVNAN